MPKKDALPPISSNLTPLKKAIKTAVDELTALAGTHAACNADKAVIIEELEAKGINRHALRMAMQYAAMSETQRQNFDVAYELVRDAIGEPLQGSLALNQAAE